MAEPAVVQLKPVVHFREFPFGTSTDPSMQECMSAEPWPDQDRVLEYLRSGHILALPMGANLPDWFDRPHQANPVINGQVEGGATPMGDGVWFWYAGLIYFIEKYNVRLPEEFVQYAAEQGWRVNRPLDKGNRYIYSYFVEQGTNTQPVAERTVR
jgi:hypothetical protein